MGFRASFNPAKSTVYHQLVETASQPSPVEHYEPPPNRALSNAMRHDLPLINCDGAPVFGLRRVASIGYPFGAVQSDCAISIEIGCAGKL